MTEDEQFMELEMRLARQERAKRRKLLIEAAQQAGFDVDEDSVHAPASGRFGLDPRLEKFAELINKPKDPFSLDEIMARVHQHPRPDITDD